MPELPLLSGNRAIKVFEDLGFIVIRQKGSHVVLPRGDRGCVIPTHKQLAIVPSGAPSNKLALLSRNSLRRIRAR
jgi:predicted RNA binding protein YcfA (HicA-like mRNA interferase family)